MSFAAVRYISDTKGKHLMEEKKFYTVALVTGYSKTGVVKYEKHNERKNREYSNIDICPERRGMNVQYVSRWDEGETYAKRFQDIVDEFGIETKWIRQKQLVYDEMILDVSADYFEGHGGYEGAVEFFRDAYHFAEKKYGERCIVSAVLHADEKHPKLSMEYGHDVYHYHLHVVAVPVVKGVKKTGKGNGTPENDREEYAEVNKISHWVKWGRTPLRDESGAVITDDNKNPVLISGLSSLQSDFYEHMRESGYDDISRGEKKAEYAHLKLLEHKIRTRNEMLENINREISESEAKLSGLKSVRLRRGEIDKIGKKGLFGNVSAAEEDFKKLKKLAKECIYLREEISEKEETIGKLKKDLEAAGDRIRELETRISPYIKLSENHQKELSWLINEVFEKNNTPRRAIGRETEMSGRRRLRERDENCI